MSMFDPSNRPPPVVTPMMPPSGPIPYLDYVYKNGAHPNDKELRHYTMTTEAYLYEQKEWTEKTIRTREKLEKLQERIWKDLPNYYGEISPMEIVSYMVDSVKVSEFIGKIIVTMLSPEGVEWCNQMWEELDGK
jgi:hypothetical protein